MMCDFVRASRVPGMPRPILAVLAAVAVAACNSPQFEAWQEGQAKFASTGEFTSGGAEDPTTSNPGSESSAESGAGASGSGSEAGATTVDTTTDETADATTTDATDTGDTEPGPPVGDADKPSIVSVELPAKVYTAGPVPLVVQTEHTSIVRVSVDGVDAGELVAVGEGLFTGDLPVHGAIDNGTHNVEIVAAQGPYEDSQPASYEVATPDPGTMAWFKAGPAGSRTNRVALTPQRDPIEGGQLEINGLARPSLRKRSGITGAELWSVPIDTREGAVADLAVLPDGRMWVAMNVREPGDPSPQPRIALFDAGGEFTGIEALGDIGQGVRGIAADAEGGCFAVGFATAGSDLDVAILRINAAGVQTLGDTWDYVLDNKSHTYWDFATDVVIEDNIAWVIGASAGKHDDDQLKPLRGILVPMDVNTGEVLLPVIIAPKSGEYTQSVFLGGALHPAGVLVTGYGCDNICSSYQIETSLYDAAGKQLWHQYDAAGSGNRYGSAVTLDSQGRAIISASVPQNGALRGYVFARVVGEKAALPIFEHWFPASKPSEALGVTTDVYDRIFPVGYITTNGSTQARIELNHG